MSGPLMENEVARQMLLLGWRSTSLPEKEPGVDLLCAFPNPEQADLPPGPGMTIYIQVKSSQRPTASAIGIKNLSILQRLQVPIFWYCMSPTDTRSRIIYYLSPEWMANAIRTESKQHPIRQCGIRKRLFREPVRSDLPCRILQSFIQDCYESFLKDLGDGALVPFARQSESSSEWANHIERTASHLRGLRSDFDIEASLEAAKLYRIAGQYDRAVELLQEAKKLLEAVPADDMRHSWCYYELSYLALVRGDYRQARKWARLSSTDGIRRSIADTVTALSYYLPVLESGRRNRDYDDKVLKGLTRALDGLRRARASSRDDRELKIRWQRNVRVHLAEAHAVNAILTHAQMDIAVVRDFRRVRRNWLESRLVGAVASCIFVEALFAILRRDRATYQILSIYLNGIKEGDFDRLRSGFLTKVGTAQR